MAGNIFWIVVFWTVIGVSAEFGSRLLNTLDIPFGLKVILVIVEALVCWPIIYKPLIERMG